MPPKVTTATRIFKYGSAMLADPNPKLDPEEVKKFYTRTYPELVTAIVEEGDFNGKTITYEFKKSVGLKG